MIPVPLTRTPQWRRPHSGWCLGKTSRWACTLVATIRIKAICMACFWTLPSRISTVPWTIPSRVSSTIAIIAPLWPSPISTPRPIPVSMSTPWCLLPSIIPAIVVLPQVLLPCCILLPRFFYHFCCCTVVTFSIHATKKHYAKSLDLLQCSAAPISNAEMKAAVWHRCYFRQAARAEILQTTVLNNAVHENINT